MKTTEVYRLALCTLQAKCCDSGLSHNVDSWHVVVVTGQDEVFSIVLGYYAVESHTVA
jgi:hypothetical protein